MSIVRCVYFEPSMSMRTKPPTSRAVSSTRAVSSRQKSSAMSRPNMVSLMEMLRSTSGGIMRRSCSLHSALRRALSRSSTSSPSRSKVAAMPRRCRAMPAAIASCGSSPATNRRARNASAFNDGAAAASRAGLVVGPHHRRDAATHVELAFHGDPARPQRRHEVVQDHVGHVFVVDASLAVGLQVQLQALQLHAEAVRHVADADRPEVGLPGLGAHRRELRARVHDRVVAAGMRVGKRFELRHVQRIYSAK